LQPIFNTAKFVVAGIVVALVGGFLLAAVLTGQQSDETPLLPGVALVTEEVRRGVYRVFSDGEHDLSENVRSVAVTADEDVWIEQHSDGTEHRVLQLGEPGVSVRSGDELSFDPSSDGNVVLRGEDGSRRILKGEHWVSLDVELHCGALGEVLAPDGACWSVLTDVRSGMQQVDADGERLTFTPMEMGLDPDGAHVRHVVGAADGTIWTDVFAPVGDATEAFVSSDVLDIFRGLAAFDGQRWTNVAYATTDDDVEGLLGVDLAVAPDGVVWVTFERPGAFDPSTLVVKSWDGSTWTSYGPLETDVGHYVSTDYGLDGTYFLPDGSIWLGRMATIFDGATLRRIEWQAPTANRLPGVESISYMPDGSAWVVLAEDLTSERVGLYVIRPEAAAGDG
jgi:hypothetical protein